MSILKWLFELAYREKREVESRLTDQYPSLVEHLVKIYLFRDKQNLNGWLKTIENIINNMLDIIFLSNVKITTKRLKNWLFFDKIDIFINRKINVIKKNPKYALLEIASDDETVKCFVKKRVEQVFKILTSSNPEKELDDLIESIKDDVINYNYDCR
jgi:predicted house-cleaning noncanonical NTP pyrophosphatase (MazG superfamily)